MKKIAPAGPYNARLMFVAEAPGADEEDAGIPLVGASGQEFDRMLREVGLLAPQETARDRYFLTNVCKYRPPSNQIGHFFHTKTEAKKLRLEVLNDRYPNDLIREGLNELAQEINTVVPDVIVALGSTALWALKGVTKGNDRWPGGINAWRGSVTSASALTLRPDGRPYKLIPMVHPAATLRQWSHRILQIHDLRERVIPALADGPYLPDPGYQFRIRPSFGEAQRWLTDLLATLDERPCRVASDTETQHHRYIACISFATSPRDAFCIPLTTVEDPKGYWTPRQEHIIRQHLRAILTHPNAQIIGQNWEYDRQYILRELLVKARLWMDTMTAHHTVFPGLPNNIVLQSSLYCAHHEYWKDDLREWDQKEVPDEDLYWAYNCRDSAVDWEIADVLDLTIDAQGLREPYEFRASLHDLVFDLINRGIRVDEGARSTIDSHLTLDKLERASWFQDMVGYNVDSNSKSPWWASPAQISTLLFDRFNIRPHFTRKAAASSKGSTSDDYFPDYMAQEPLVTPILRRLQEYRTASVMQANHVRATLASGRVHPGWNMDGTETYRWSCSKNAFGEGFNAQNITSGDEEDD